MSKTFEDCALKIKGIAEGCMKNFDEVSKFGFKENDLKKLSEDADKAIEMIREVEKLREEVSQKLHAANSVLVDMKDRTSGYRRTIKNNYPQEKWGKFRIGDKR